MQTERSQVRSGVANGGGPLGWGRSLDERQHRRGSKHASPRRVIREWHRVQSATMALRQATAQ